MTSGEMSGRSVLVTGATGFIGRAIAELWQEAGADVVGIHCRETPLLQLEAPFDLRKVCPSPAGFAAVVDSLHPDIIFHAAGSASVAGSIADPAGDFAAGPQLFQILLEGVRRSRYRPRILFPSSAAVYGNPEVLPVAESATPRPISPYGHNKAAAEMVARQYALCFEIPVLVLRLFSLFGPRQKKLLLWELFNQLNVAERVIVQGTGHEVRDFLHVNQLARIAAVVALDAADPFTVLNVATGKGNSVRAVAELMRRLLQSSKPISYANRSRPGNPDRWIADISALSAFPAARNILLADNFESELAGSLDAWRR